MKNEEKRANKPLLNFEKQSIIKNQIQDIHPIRGSQSLNKNKNLSILKKEGQINQSKDNVGIQNRIDSHSLSNASIESYKLQSEYLKEYAIGEYVNEQIRNSLHGNPPNILDINYQRPKASAINLKELVFKCEEIKREEVEGGSEKELEEAPNDSDENDESIGILKMDAPEERFNATQGKMQICQTKMQFL